MPKGVLYSHRSTMLHTLGVAAGNPMGLGISEQDVILPVVPMFHANAWGYPYLATMLGAKLVYPGPFLDPESLLDAFVSEGVTWTAGVPTIWLGILQLLDDNPGRWDLSRMKGMLVGGSAAPRSMIAGFKERHGLDVVHGWGMTETSPVATTAQLPGELSTADPDTRYDFIAMQGRPLPLVELRHRDVEGNVLPWDGEAMGELETRGPWVAAAYYETPEQVGSLDRRRLVQDRRRRHDPPARLHPDQGPLQGRDQVGRRVDLVGRARERTDGAPGGRRGCGDRDSRPEVGRTAARGGGARGGAGRHRATSCATFLAPDFAKWWLPDRFEFIAEIPKTSVGKFRKTELREMFARATRRALRDQDRLARQPAGQRRQRRDHRHALDASSSSSTTTIRVVVLRGKGERAFSAGADIARLLRAAATTAAARPASSRSPT